MKMRLAWVCTMALGGGCATTAKETTEAVEPVVKAAQAASVPPDKLEEIDLFFHRKIPSLQFDCYNSEVESTHKKYEGNLSLALVVNPGGKASDVKVTASTLHSLDDEKAPAPNIENCVTTAMKDWEWPDVPAPAPYTGSINFKPAW